jgi:hypothetical protein
MSYAYELRIILDTEDLSEANERAEKIDQALADANLDFAWDYSDTQVYTY